MWAVCIGMDDLVYSDKVLTLRKIRGIAAMFKRLCAVTAAALLTVATYAAAVEMREGHPTTYTVQRGDTLWGIAGRFLTKPWLWPEIWQANPQIENPHRIFPGDVISLAYLDGRPVLSTTRSGPRSEPAITTIPLTDIESFLRQNSVVTDFEDLPHVVAVEEDHLRGAVGQNVYIRGLQGAKAGDTLTLVRPSQHFRLPAARRITDTLPSDLDHRGDEAYRSVRSAWGRDLAHGDSLGYELTRQALARVTQVQGEVTVALLVEGPADVRPGDRAVPAEAQPYDDSFLPRAPTSIPAHAAVIAIADAGLSGGPNTVVALAAGSADGVKNGTVFSTWRPGDAVPDDVLHANRLRAATDKVQLPDEFTGRVMVFRTFDRVSYALVMEGIRPVMVGDKLKGPDATQ